MYTVEGTYNGDETGTLWLDLTIGVFAGGTYYNECSNVVPGDILDAPEVSNGASASGSDCAEFPRPSPTAPSSTSRTSGRSRTTTGSTSKSPS
ncbi:hypothetical protein GCM10029992_20450 [Glycomyces albus]